MATKKDTKKAGKSAKSPSKKSAPAKAKPAPAKAGKSSAKAKPVKAKPASKPVAKSKPAPKAVSKPAKGAIKPALKKGVAPAKPSAVKAPVAKTGKSAAKPAPVAKPAGKPIQAVLKKDAGKKGAKPATGKKGEEGEVKDEFGKHEEEHIEGALEEPVALELEPSAAPEIIDEDDDEVPEKRGRGRRKKNEGKSTGGTMEAYIRNRPLQIDIHRTLVKKGNVAAPKPFVNTDDKRTRYSDKELAEFKELILEKLREAQADYELLKQTLSNEDNHGTDDTSPSFKLLEDGSDVMSKEETAQLASRQEKYIINLKNALVRIENKAYGICRVTGKLIPKERLRSVPHATLGIDAKLNQG
jgi:DnaK suppressor protein